MLNGRTAAVDFMSLAHVVALAAVERAGARALVVKGPSAEFHGLRDPHVSVDVDIFVDPCAVNAVLSSLASFGWHPRELSTLAKSLEQHSTSVTHAKWPCDIDVHHRIPGLLVDPSVAFDSLFSARCEMEIAGRALPIPSQSAAILIGALHALYTPNQTPRHAREFQRLRELAMASSDDARRDIVGLAQQLGASDTARPLLLDLVRDLPPETGPGVDPQLDAWRARSAAGGHRAARIWLEAGRQPATKRARYLALSAWPRREDLLLEHSGAGSATVVVVRLRIRRLVRGLVALPLALHGMRTARRGGGDMPQEFHGDRA